MANYSNIHTFEFTAVQEELTDAELTLTANPDDENGRIEISFERSAAADPIVGTIVIRRSSSETNFTI